MPRGFDEREWLDELPRMSLAELRAQLEYLEARLRLGGHAEGLKTWAKRIRAVEAEIRERFPND